MRNHLGGDAIMKAMCVASPNGEEKGLSVKSEFPTPPSGRKNNGADPINCSASSGLTDAY
jgi:hypothetical protein